MCLACEMDAWWLPAIEAAREAKTSRDTADLTLVPFAAASKAAALNAPMLSDIPSPDAIQAEIVSPDRIGSA